ncbi:hypothetical protein FISHEDRAFT_71148 [Fistulina hepatica ATCC 64428]|nr:hypothetical protein FISHEDRAFT_71148 [Fistulina hepatica ATCC 64428]
MVAVRAFVLAALIISSGGLASPVVETKRQSVSEGACQSAGGYTQNLCCNPEQTAQNMPANSSLGGLVNALLGVVPNVGLACSPVSVLISPSSVDCNMQSVCCDHADPTGVANLNCVPLNAAL